MSKYKVALIAFCCALPLLMAPTGGFPSRPKFQALTVTGNADLSTIDSIAVSDFARLSQASTFLNPVTVSNGLPFIRLNESDAAADNSKWLLYAQGEGLCLGPENDSGSSSCALSVQRTGQTVDSLAITAPSVAINGRVIASQGIFADGFNAPATGTHVGIGVSSGTAFVQAHNRSLGSFIPLQLEGSQINLATNGGTATVSGVQICQADGTGCPAAATLKFAFAKSDGAGAIVGPSYGVTGVAGTAGQYAVDLTAAGFISVPVCNATLSVFSASWGPITVANASATGVEVFTWASGSPSAAPFTLQCMGV